MEVMNSNTPFTSMKGKITDEQWDVARPLVQRLYMDENKSFSFVANALQTEHGFCPTKRQFDRRVSVKWAMRKNSSKEKRRLAVQQLESTIIDLAQTCVVVRRIDRPLNATKLRRWRRELGRSVQLNMQPDTPDTSYASATVLGSTTQLSAIAYMEPSSVPAEVIGDGFEDKTMWDLARIMESPNLTTLFSAFHISGLNPEDKDVPLISLSLDEIRDDLEEELTCLSASDLIEIQMPSINTESNELDSAPHASALVPYTLSRDRAPSFRSRGLKSVQNRQGNFHVGISPFNELYYFANNEPIPSRANFKIRQLPLSFLEEKLQKLSGVMPQHHNLVICTMEQLSSKYFEQGFYRQATDLYQRLLSAMEDKHGYNHFKTLDARLNLVRGLQNLGRYRDAKGANTCIRDTIASLYPGNCELLCKSMIMLANEKYYFDNFEDAERIEREVLQIELNLHGPKGAMKSLFSLGITISKYSHTLAERLFRSGIQLLDQSSDISEHQRCEYLNQLAFCLSQQGKRSEADILFAHVRKHAKSVLSEVHPTVLSLEFDFAVHLALEGNYDESCAVLKNTINRYEATGITFNVSGFAMMAYLGNNLQYGLGKFEEACGWYEKAIFGLTFSLGIEYEIALETCHNLGICYRETGRHGKALDFFQDTLSKLKMVDGNFESLIARLEDEIAECKEYLEDERSSLIDSEEIYEDDAMDKDEESSLADSEDLSEDEDMNEDEDGDGDENDVADEEMGDIYSAFDEPYLY